MPEVCPNCGSAEIGLFSDRSGKCRRCNSSFRQPNVVDVVSPKPFSEVMGGMARQSSTSEEAVKPEWRRTFQKQWTWTPRPPPWTPSTPNASVYPTTSATPVTAAVYSAGPVAVKWGAAIGYGLLVALIGGFIWGLIGGFAGYIFTLVAIAIGVAVAWAVRKGAGTANWGVIILAFILTIIAIFIGDIISLSIALGAHGWTVFNVLANYPTIIALAPGEVCMVYIFGLGGAAYGAYSLWKEMSSSRARGTQIGYPQYSGVSQSVYSSDMISTGVQDSTFPQADMPTVQVLACTATEAKLQINFPSPVSKIVIARYETMFGKASVYVNGAEVANTRVWTAQKTLDVPLPSHPARILKVRFFGFPRPQIEVSAGGIIIASC